MSDRNPPRRLLRDAQPSDSDAVARVHVLTWQTAYQGLIPDAYPDSLRPEVRARRHTFGSTDPSSPQTIVALDDGDLIGFATVLLERGEDSSGELSALHVNPSHWGRVIGAALISAARARPVEQGCRYVRLWLLEGSVRAERFYRMDGWFPDGTRRPDVVWGVTVVEIGFRRELP